MLSLLSLKQFLRDMRSQKLRTMMTMFGILWGTVSIILLMAFGTGMQEFQVRRTKGLGENITIFWPGLTSKPWKGLPQGRRIRFTADDAALIKRAVPTVKSISPEFRAHNIMLRSHRNNLTAMVAGVWPEFNDMRNIIPAEGGRFINDKDMAEKRRTVFIGDELAERLFPGEDPVGQSLQIRGMPFVVVGVMMEKDQSSSYGGRDTRNAYIPASTYLTMHSRRFPDNMVMQTTSLEVMKETIDEIYGFMAAKYNFDPKDTEALGTWDVSENFKFINTFFLAFRAFLVGIGCLTLVTGGIGVTNIMNVVLEERTKEIGIKMALGAKKRTIMTQFLFETLMLIGIGGGLGFAISIGIIKVYPIINQYTNISEHLGTPTMHMTENIVAVAILGCIAFLAGFFPARRAANLEPVKALKLM